VGNLQPSVRKLQLLMPPQIINRRRCWSSYWNLYDYN